ncbi:hypothetical protein EFW17_13410 [Halostreptopolyspora alba]|uniref:Tyr recombinase domain-containing protein n=2 Tax=Halostreptopolyspora alba TaxID=2487137 RepID=A0A3N0E8P7_9ACTN|nr:hypothetical protein EFW17_13410 [Nocardiopsaceae bacterium YIM 96095]
MRLRNWSYQEFYPALGPAGLEGTGLPPHTFRHTAASLAIAAGVDIKVVQTMLGHKSATVTLDIYGHLWPDRLDEVVDVMDARRLEALTATKGGEKQKGRT